MALSLDVKLKGGHRYRVGYEARQEGAIGIFSPEYVELSVSGDCTVGEVFEAARQVLYAKKMEPRFPLGLPVDLGPQA